MNEDSLLNMSNELILINILIFGRLFLMRLEK